MPIVNPIASVAEVQTVTVNATGGTFTVTYGGATTSALAFNVSAAAFTAAMDLITTRAGDCVVTGGPGAAGGGTPYTLTWRLGLGDVPAPTTDATSLTGGAGTAAVATTTTGVAGWEPVTLHAGEHDEPTSGQPPGWQWNMMEAASWMADDPWLSEPANVSPVIAAVCNSFNDLLDDTNRQDLVTYLDVAPAGVIDTVDGAKETAREWMCSDWLVRELVPMWLDYTGDTDVLAASTAIKALPALAAGTFDEAATLAALEDAGRALWAWRNTLLPDSFELTGGGGPCWAAASLPTLFDLLGGDFVDHYWGQLRGVDGLTSGGADDGATVMAEAIRAAHQAAWDTALAWVPAEFFTGRSVDYAFRRGGDFVPGSAFMLLRDAAWALVTGQALTDAISNAYDGTIVGFGEFYAEAFATADEALVGLGANTDTVALMLALIADLSAY